MTVHLPSIGNYDIHLETVIISFMTTILNKS